MGLGKVKVGRLDRLLKQDGERQAWGKRKEHLAARTGSVPITRAGEPARRWGGLFASSQMVRVKGNQEEEKRQDSEQQTCWSQRGRGAPRHRGERDSLYEPQLGRERPRRKWLCGCSPRGYL